MPIPETVTHSIGCRRSDIWDLTPSLIFLLLTFMATRRRSSATKTAKSAPPKTVKESVISVKKVTAKPAKRVNKVTRTAKSAVTEVTTTPEIKETKVSTKSWIEKLRELDGFSLIILPFLYLEGFAKLLLKNQF